MGVIWTPLVLLQPNRADGSRADIPHLPPGLPQRLEEGSRTLDAGLLVGETLGLDLSELSECLHTVWFSPPHRGKGLFTDDDIPVLLEGYTRIRNTLRAALDDQGRPIGAGGSRLKNASSIEQYPDGGMVTRSRRVRLIDLLGDLDGLLRFLTFARDRRLYMRDGDAPDLDDPEREGDV